MILSSTNGRVYDGEPCSLLSMQSGATQSINVFFSCHCNKIFCFVKIIPTYRQKQNNRRAEYNYSTWLWLAWVFHPSDVGEACFSLNTEFLYCFSSESSKKYKIILLEQWQFYKVEINNFKHNIMFTQTLQVIQRTCLDQYSNWTVAQISKVNSCLWQKVPTGLCKKKRVILCMNAMVWESTPSFFSVTCYSNVFLS